MGEDRSVDVARPDGFVVLVEFKLHPGAAATFWQALRVNAASSVRDEPGCRRFDLLTPEGGADPHHVVLYEIYADAAAFQAHLETPHFAAFDKVVQPLIAERRLLRLDVHENFKPEPAR